MLLSTPYAGTEALCARKWAPLVSLPTSTCPHSFPGAPPTFRRYCDFVRTQVGSPDALIPPPPPLTRYKRELAVAAEEAAAAAAYGAPPSQLSKVGVAGMAWCVKVCLGGQLRRRRRSRPVAPAISCPRRGPAWIGALPSAAGWRPTDELAPL